MCSLECIVVLEIHQQHVKEGKSLTHHTPIRYNRIPKWQTPRAGCRCRRSSRTAGIHTVLPAPEKKNKHTVNTLNIFSVPNLSE